MSEPYDIGDPSDTARALFAAQTAERWSDVAAFTHRDAASHFKRQAILFALEEERRRAPELLTDVQDPDRILLTKDDRTAEAGITRHKTGKAGAQVERQRKVVRSAACVCST